MAFTKWLKVWDSNSRWKGYFQEHLGLHFGWISLSGLEVGVAVTDLSLVQASYGSTNIWQMRAHMIMSIKNCYR
ncbi:conserved hypothetical protein [Ricinus communis]|uniref:Uncharacterized protein n=1 Tax=Ricinus communis TaxID=3988 RepID=B9S1Y0_RICCO|nr:conserved hypothetical protein [Ricinus communis]